MTKIKDILNRDLVNLVNCESEPIHIPGSIQPHGFLLAINAQNNLIDFCSANCHSFTAFTPQMILGKPLSDIFSKEETDEFENHVQHAIDYAKPFVFTLNQVRYNTTTHRSKKHFILEFEPFPDGSLHLPDLYNQTRKFVSFMEGTSKLIDLCQAIAAETRDITGYDRVLIYRFDKYYNGEVIAESKRKDLISFAGQKYPHTDIPAQARELYIRNPIRMIADINYVPVPLLTLDDKEERDNQSLDLSLSMLRSVSPIHIEYLKNMGVGATLTISLVKDQKLWGLIACHHHAPKILPHYTRLAALLQGHFLTSQITVREVGEEFEVAQKVERALQEALLSLHENENISETLYRSPFLLQLANATGVIILHEGIVHASGTVPPNQDIIKLHTWLTSTFDKKHFSTSFLTEIYPEGEYLSEFAAGLLYYPLSGTDCILWLRAEVIQTISWAGNPNKAVEINETSGHLTPRKSFELWMEVVKNKSADWRKSELNATSSFAHALQKHINLHYVRRQEEKYRALNEELKAANKELANLNWISTHDLKEPLRKIQIFASKVLAADITEQVKDSVIRMRIAAEKMQRLIEDILSYSKAGNMEKIFVETDLNQILTDVLTDMHEEILEKNALISSDQLPVILAIPFQISQLFINIISNALKFIHADNVPQINITLSTVRGYNFPDPVLIDDRSYYQIAFKDNGIGFEKVHNERIFDVFQRLHSTSKYPGSGIGLAICKKITENHKGTILTQSVPGAGSVFSIFLPIT